MWQKNHIPSGNKNCKKLYISTRNVWDLGEENHKTLPNNLQEDLRKIEFPDGNTVVL